MNTLGNKICQYRQLRKMTQEEFASRLGVTPQAVSKWERGNSFPDVMLVKGICDVLGVTPNILLDTENKVVENGDIYAEKEIRTNMLAEPLVLEFGEKVIPCIATGLKTNYINQKRKELVTCTGMLMPILRIRDNLDLDDNAYRIIAYDRVLFEEVLEDYGEGTFNKIIDNVLSMCEENYASIINKQIVKIMVDSLRSSFPAVVEGLVPDKISYLELERELQKRIGEKKSIRDLIHILEEMEEGRQ